MFGRGQQTEGDESVGNNVREENGSRRGQEQGEEDTELSLAP